MQKPPCMVWLPADHRLLGVGSQAMPFLILGDKYARVVKESVGAQPVMFPLADAAQVAQLLALVDGVMLTGSPANVHPSHFGEDVADSSLPLDPQRDALTLELVRACVAQSVPLLGICRGFQEINVALGGSLHQGVHALSDMLDHRDQPEQPTEVRYAASHPVQLVAGSCLAQWAGSDSAQVNSLHGQGINQLAQGLRALAYAPDGLVEAFELRDAANFACAVQWHPEWRTAEVPFYAAMMNAFGQACQRRHALRCAT